MKFILCVIAIFAALQNVECGVPNRDIEMEMMMQYQRSRQTRPEERLQSIFDNICPGYSQKLQNATMELTTCQNTIKQSEETVCSIARNDVKRCFSPIISLLEECLPTESKPIPALAMDTLISTSNYLCRIDGEHLFELANPCLRKINSKTQECLRQITSKIQEYQSNLPSAQNICIFLESLRPCLQSQLNGFCQNRITQESVFGLFDEAMKPCKKYENNATAAADIDLIDL